MCSATTISSVKVQVPQPVFEIKFWEHNKDNKKDDGLWDNPCWPKTLVPDDPGFALLTNDEWYSNHKAQAKTAKNYAKPPSDKVLGNKKKLVDKGDNGWGDLGDGLDVIVTPKPRPRDREDRRDRDYTPDGIRLFDSGRELTDFQPHFTPVTTSSQPSSTMWNVVRRGLTDGHPPVTKTANKWQA